MVAHIRTIAFHGVDALAVDVQVHLAPGQNAFTVVGLPDKSVAESRERVRAALAAVGLGLPYERITINLSPADLPKEGSHYDLPIALGLIVAMGGLDQAAIDDYVVMGELGLDGACIGVPGVLPAPMAALQDQKGLICPAACGSEAAWSGLGRPENPELLAAADILQAINHLRGTHLLAPPQPEAPGQTQPHPDMADIRGQHRSRLALEVTAAGGHNLLMSGPPGAGKSMLAARLPSVLPELTASERLEISIIESLSSRRVGCGWPINARFAHRIIRPAWRPWLAAGAKPSRARFHWLIRVCCFSMNYPSLTAKRSMLCASRLKPAASRWPALMRMFSIRRSFN